MVALKRLSNYFESYFILLGRTFPSSTPNLFSPPLNAAPKKGFPFKPGRRLRCFSSSDTKKTFPYLYRKVFSSTTCQTELVEVFTIKHGRRLRCFSSSRTKKPFRISTERFSLLQFVRLSLSKSLQSKIDVNQKLFDRLRVTPFLFIEFIHQKIFKLRCFSITFFAYGQSEIIFKLFFWASATAAFTSSVPKPFPPNSGSTSVWVISKIHAQKNLSVFPPKGFLCCYLAD